MQVTTRLNLREELDPKRLEAAREAIHRAYGYPKFTAEVPVRAYLSASPIEAPGQDMVMVPRNPTEAMLAEGLVAGSVSKDHEWSASTFLLSVGPGVIGSIYRAMIDVFLKGAPMPVSEEQIEREAIRQASISGVIYEELDETGSDGENKRTYRRIAKGILQAAASVPPDSGVAVAWRYRGGIGPHADTWYVSATKPFSDDEAKRDGWEQQPLYAHPSKSYEDGVKEALADVERVRTDPRWSGGHADWICGVIRFELEQRILDLLSTNGRG